MSEPVSFKVCGTQYTINVPTITNTKALKKDDEIVCHSSRKRPNSEMDAEDDPEPKAKARGKGKRSKGML